MQNFALMDILPPYRLDKNSNGGGILLYVREDIPFKMIKADFEGFFIEIDLRGRKLASCLPL